MKEFNVFKIVFSSSATVYGLPQYLPIDENHPTGNCTNPYGKTKYFTEQIMEDLTKADTVSYKNEFILYGQCLITHGSLFLYTN